jgi:riboflavin biosynthesis pyrimidine reductase
MRLIHPSGTGQAELTASELAGLYAYPEAAQPLWLRANMVASVDGAASLAGRSGGLSGAADRLVFGLLRGLADVVLVGAGTARAEGYGPARPAAGPWWQELRAGRTAVPPIAVVTRLLSLDLSVPLITGAPADARTIIITTAVAPADRRAAAAAAGADVLIAGDGTVDMRAAVAALAGLGHRRLLTEGGPRLLGELAGYGLLDELCLTLSPVLAGGAAGRIVDAAGARAAAAGGQVLAGADPGSGHGSPGSLGQLALSHVLADEGYLLCRYLRAE